MMIKIKCRYVVPEFHFMKEEELWFDARDLVDIDPPEPDQIGSTDYKHDLFGYRDSDCFEKLRCIGAWIAEPDSFICDRIELA